MAFAERRICLTLFVSCCLLGGFTPNDLRGQDNPQRVAAAPTTAPSRDSLLGWYQLPNRRHNTGEVLPGPGTLIPVFKRDQSYYSVCRGIELPLKECPEGLKWGATPSSMEGTMIGLDQASGKPYIIINDRNAQYEADWSTYGERQYLVRVEKPAGLLDATAETPQSNEDFVGVYQGVWIPIRYEIRKEGEMYIVVGQRWGMQGWTAEQRVADPSAKLVPATGRLGFVLNESRKSSTRLIFNEALQRFELEVTGKNDVDGIRMPLARIRPAPTKGKAAPPLGNIGIPSWN